MKRVIAIGTLDGVHLGHQAILRKAVQLAGKRRWQAMALTFDRPPRKFFKPASSPYLLTCGEEKKYLCRRYGIKKVVVMPFNNNLAKMSAADFFERVIIKKFHAAAVVVGYNFGFGKGREGTPELLSRIGAKYKIGVHVVPEIKLGNKKVSSGKIRDLLARGDIRRSSLLLNHPYIVMGGVVHGDGRGKILGFPTANLKVPPVKIMPPGVFAARCRVLSPGGSRSYKGICNIGFRPTFKDGAPALSLEVHLLRFHGRLYGRALRVELIKKIRSERKFPDARALQKQLKMDRVAALQVLR